MSYHLGSALSLSSRDASLEPLTVSPVSSWLWLPASVQSGGEWTSLVDVLNPNPATQADTDRRATVGSSPNGYPTAVFDGSDMYPVPLIAANNSITDFFIACWVSFAAVAAADQILFAIFNAAGGASLRKLQTGIATSGMRTSVWVSSAAGTGRNINSAAGVITAATFGFFLMQYRSSIGGDACVEHYWNNLFVPQSGNSNIGAGGTLGVMESPTGSAVIGSQDDQDSPIRALVNGSVINDGLYIGNGVLTAAQRDRLMAFRRPT